MKREGYLDSLKIMAIFIIYATHFISQFHKEYFFLWSEMPSRIVFGGLTGKFGVALFGVILGYLAYKSSETNIAKYSIKRYIYFVLCGLFVNTLYAVLGTFGYFHGVIGVTKVLRTSFLVGDQIFATYWCMRPFLVASIFSRINGQLRLHPVIILAEIVGLILIEQPWIAICMLGNLIPSIRNIEFVDRLLENSYVKIAGVILALWIIKLDSKYIYLLYGLSSVIIILALTKDSHIKSLMEKPFFTHQGQNTMAIYLIHVAVYNVLGGSLIFKMFGNQLPFLVVFTIAFVLCWIAIVLLSFPLNKLLCNLNKLITRKLSLSRQEKQ